jgi:hypothetical protein
VIGQPPRFALATPVFRFRSLATLAGRAPLGGDRETLLVCLQIGRLCAGILKPYELSDDTLNARIEGTKQWLASMAIPNAIRSAAFGIFGALAGHERTRAAQAFEDLVKAAAAQLDETSRAELNQVIQELNSGRA